ncbi:hypothetical protein AMECASPLE_024671 [Ameca splendens]|uniref:THAP-type domain-containing protein n=1 Tax=Ameca splendens TaxID=208324 RepID=A0ABV1ABA5_9TELE
MPMFCAVYSCSNRSSREKEKHYYRVPKVVVHKGERCIKLTEKRRKKWITNLRLRSGGAESANARVCSDHFVSGEFGVLRNASAVSLCRSLHNAWSTCTYWLVVVHLKEESTSQQPKKHKGLSNSREL